MASNGIKFPPFYEVDVRIWIMQVEAFFSISRITDDEEKFKYIVVHATRIILPFIADFIEEPPLQNKYENVKKRILSVFAKDEEKKMDDLIKEVKSLTTEPSKLLKAMHICNRNKHFTDNALKEKFVRQINNVPAVYYENEDVVDFDRLGKEINNIPKCSIRLVPAPEKIYLYSDPPKKIPPSVTVIKRL